MFNTFSRIIFLFKVTEIIQQFKLFFFENVNVLRYLPVVLHNQIDK